MAFLASADGRFWVSLPLRTAGFGFYCRLSNVSKLCAEVQTERVGQRAVGLLPLMLRELQLKRFPCTAFERSLTETVRQSGAGAKYGLPALRAGNERHIGGALCLVYGASICP